MKDKDGSLMSTSSYSCVPIGKVVLTMAKYDYWISKEGLIEVEGLARDGLTDKQIATAIGIAESTLNDWKKRFPEFSKSLKNGKVIVDRQVENALLKSALGFSYVEEMVTNQGNVVKTTKYSKPNVTAQIFWLKNRKPDEWREKQEFDVTQRTVNIKVGEWDDDD